MNLAGDVVNGEDGFTDVGGGSQQGKEGGAKIEDFLAGVRGEGFLSAALGEHSAVRSEDLGTTGGFV